MAYEALRPLLDQLASFLKRREFGGLDSAAAAANGVALFG